jgi:hypothetical protein
MPEQANGNSDGIFPVPHADDLARLPGIAGKIALPAPSLAIDKIRRVLRIAGSAWRRHAHPDLEMAVFEARCTDCNRSAVFVRNPGRSVESRGALLPGARSHNPLHHGDEPLLIRLA